MKIKKENIGNFLQVSKKKLKVYTTNTYKRKEPTDRVNVTIKLRQGGKKL